MIGAEQYYKNKDGKHFDEVRQQASSQSLNGWEEYYWAGLYLNEYAPDGTYYELITETLEESFFEGLTYLSNRACYLDVVKVLGRLYLELQQYDLALNMLQMLILKDPNVPDWVYLRYAYAQLHSDTAQRLADEPEYLFERLDRVDAADTVMVDQRAAIFEEYLDICRNFHVEKEIRIDTTVLFNKAAELGVLHSDSWKRFALEFPSEFGTVSAFDVDDDEPEIDVPDEVVKVQKHLSKESRGYIFEFFTDAMQSHRDYLEDSRRTQGLASDVLNMHVKEKNIVKLAAMEGAVAVMARAIGGSEMNQKVAFTNSSKILVDRCGFGEAVAIDVTVVMAKAMGFSIAIDEFDDDDIEEAFTNFSDSLVGDLEKENADLLEKIHELQAQMSDLIRKNQSYEDLLEEKKAIIEQMTANEACIDNIAKSEANGITNGHDLLDGNKKILVIGQPVVSTDKLLGIVKVYGYEKSDFIFWDDYDKIKSYAERMAGGSFTGIIAGPMPHKVSGLGDYSSLIEKMKQPGYPYMEEARSESGELKITKNSFRKALEGMTKHLLAIQ